MCWLREQGAQSSQFSIAREGIFQVAWMWHGLKQLSNKETNLIDSTKKNQGIALQLNCKNILNIHATFEEAKALIEYWK
jgi:hypothetical protein